MNKHVQPVNNIQKRQHLFPEFKNLVTKAPVPLYFWKKMIHHSM
jgi:hypothetical protein